MSSSWIDCLSQEERDLLWAYVDGINDFMENVGVFQEETTSYVFPLEFYAFGIPIKKWHPVDVLAICKVHNFHLSGSWPADFLREIIANLEICQEIAKNLVSQSEKKYQINFEYWEKTYPSFKKYQHYYSTSSIDFTIQCRESHEDSSVRLQIYLNTAPLREAVNDFYDSGL